MAAFTVEVKDEGVRAVLQALKQRAGNLAPVLQAIGEGITERTKHRFDTSTAPDGTPWKPNSAATLAMLAGRLSGQKSKVKKDGSLNASGARQLAGKKPLIGESHDLRRQIIPQATRDTLTVSATAKYAAMHQFGGVTSARSMIPGKTIPARPFLPVRQDGTLYPQEQALVLQALNDFLMDGLSSS
jgi:phage virion morphogenesis protein